MVKKYGVPNFNTPYCTSRMKTEPHDAWCNDKFGKGNYTSWLGIRADEPHRLSYYNSNFDMFTQDIPEELAIRYLAEIDCSGKPQINEWWAKQDFDLEIDETLWNCVFCIKKSEVKLYKAAQDEPELAAEFRGMLFDDSVRIKPTDKYERGVIYRGFLSIDKVIMTSQKLGEQSLSEAIQSAAMFEETDPTLCSASCEIMPGKAEQGDLLEHSEAA